MSLALCFSVLEILLNSIRLFVLYICITHDVGKTVSLSSERHSDFDEVDITIPAIYVEDSVTGVWWHSDIQKTI